MGTEGLDTDAVRSFECKGFVGVLFFPFFLGGGSLASVGMDEGRK